MQAKMQAADLGGLRIDARARRTVTRLTPASEEICISVGSCAPTSSLRSSMYCRTKAMVFS
jgi:hypothetical protein